MTVGDTDLAEITRTIWGTLFEVPLGDGPAAADGGGPTVTGVVHIDGAWHGAILLQCPMPVAATLTEALFQSGGEPRPDDIRDALGELTNMLAGNVKALLPEPCGISLPAVAFGSDYEVIVVGTTAVATAAFSFDDRPVVVTLLERSAPAADG